MIQLMILEVVQSKWSFTWYDPLGPLMCVLESINGDVVANFARAIESPLF